MNQNNQNQDQIFGWMDSGMMGSDWMSEEEEGTDYQVPLSEL